MAVGRRAVKPDAPSRPTPHWDLDETVALARRMQTGQVSLNGAPQNCATPFGDCGWSGVGRENGRLGIEEFLRFETVHGTFATAA